MPEEPEPTIEVGDLVRYVLRGPLSEDFPGPIWKHRSEHDAIVLSFGIKALRLHSLDTLVDQGSRGYDIDDWYAPAEHLRLVAKATYRRLP